MSNIWSTLLYIKINSKYLSITKKLKPYRHCPTIEWSPSCDIPVHIGFLKIQITRLYYWSTCVLTSGDLPPCPQTRQQLYSPRTPRPTGRDYNRKTKNLDQKWKTEQNYRFLLLNQWLIPHIFIIISKSSQLLE